MTRFLRLAAPAALVLTLGACGSLLGGGKPPATLFTITSNAPAAAPVRSAAVGETVTVRNPVVPKALRTNRVAVELGATQVQYVANLQLVDTPDRLFQDLVEETLRRMTSRVVLDPNQSTLDPGFVVTGQLNHFGYDAMQGQVVVQYDASLATQGGTHVETRRFEATAPADGSAGTVSAGLNVAANQVAQQVAQWIGG